MKYLLIAVSEMKAGPEKDLLFQYKKRLTRPFSVTEIKQRNAPLIEAEDILRHIDTSDFVCALDERGKDFSSRELCAEIENAQINHKRCVFIIGGADGLAESIRQRANLILRFGKMTWPHLLVRGMLAEQLYRMQQIMANHPYHRD